MIAYLSKYISIVLMVIFLGATSASATCQTYYPFLTNMPSAPTSTRLNLSLFSQVYSIDLEEKIEEIQCPEPDTGSDFKCFSAYSSSDGEVFVTGYSLSSFGDELRELSLDIDVLGVPAKLAPIPTPSGMVNLGYRSPNIDGEVVLMVTMPPALEEHYPASASIYPLLMRVFEADVCDDE